MQHRARWSVRNLLLVLTAAAVVPAAALLAFSVYRQYQADEREASAAAYNLAELSADSVRSFLSEGRQLLAKIAKRPLLRGDAGRGCDPIFNEFRDLYPQFANLSQSTPDGYIACSTMAQPGNVRTFVGDTAWFRQVYASQQFTIGPPYVGPVTKRVVSVLAMPVFDTAGHMSGAVQLPIDLAKFRVIPGADKLPTSTVISIFDSSGVLVARSQDAEQFVGRNLSDVEAVKAILAQKHGNLRSASSQGIERVFGFLPIPGTDWIAVAGISTDAVLHTARQAALLNLVFGGIFLALVLALAVYTGNRIALPVIAVQEAAREVAAGNLQARAPHAGPSEIAEFAAQFNSMLDAIQLSRHQLAFAHSELVLLGTCVAHLTDMVIILDARTKRDGWPVILFVNEAFVKVTGYTREEAVGATTRLLHGPKTAVGSVALLNAGLASAQPFCVEIVNHTRGGTELFIELDMIPIHADAGELTHWISIERNVTVRKLAEERIHRLAYFDALTDLPNRSLLMDRIETALSKAKRDELLGAALFIDLDNFKTVNDARGHAVGDILLQDVARRLATIVRGEDTVARLGGDEFVILLTGLSQQPEQAARIAVTVADKVRDAVLSPFEIEGLGYNASASIGVALLHGDEQTSLDLLREADTAMYRAKHGGRNRVAFFEPAMQAEVETRLALESDLAQALTREEMAIHVQTQVDHRGMPVGAELLLRWQHPVRGFISPMQFIPVAEETGAILDLGAWVLEQACMVLSRLQRAGNALSISINVSPRQFRHPDFVQQVRDALAKTDARASSLIFEVTEGLLIENLEDGIARMRELVALGIRFSIDDFGTGYSSLAYLKRLPLHELKIDKSFVMDTPRDTNDAAIVKLIIATAKNLGLQVVAEGVEKPEQAEFLARNGCDILQGYLFARPVPLEEWMTSMGSDAA
ncbi:MAG: EAL domain-containing protein [Pseudomonadota bacterium]